MATRRPMQRGAVSTASTSIRKLVDSSNSFGNTGIKNQQMTTFEIFHYLPYVPGTTLTFFEGVNAVAFPFSNINDNQLQVGEAMIIKRVWFTVATLVAGAITTIVTLEQASLTYQYLSQFNWFNDNNRVIKGLSLTNMQAEFNRKGYSTDNNVFHLETDISIQSLVRFTATLKLLPGAAVDNTMIGMHAGGIGTLLAPKRTY
jgi:hypothetical protein